MPKNYKKSGSLSINEFRNLGEKHTGYIFLTFATTDDAKRAMVLAQMNFQPFFFDKLEKAPFVDLLRDDFHMDYDEDLQIRQIGKYMNVEAQLEEDVAKLREDVLEQERFEEVT